MAARCRTWERRLDQFHDFFAEQELSRRLDRVSFLIVVVGFIAANLALVLAAL
jgi:hypothetical protein